ncbi:MAG: hypothetical protein KGL39_05260 [Patescibacteria group bacterium]|nr:hypothetical protein [Patescibacteria group bacterium]
MLNGDEINALVTKIVAVGMSSWLGASVATSAQQQTIAAGLGTLAAVLWGVYSHWNMKKVPETATVVGGTK